MALTSSVVSANHELRTKEITLAVVPTAGTAYVAGGDTLDLTASTNPLFKPDSTISAQPTTAEVISCPAGYKAELIAGSALNNWLLAIEQDSGVLGAFSDLPVANYPVGLAGKTFLCRFRGPKGIM